MNKAIENFEYNLEKFRKIVPINTISMHGKPLSKYDNRDMWRHSNFHQRLKKDFDIFGEIYLDIDYSNIAYITDAGRNWNNQNNRRDKVDSKVELNLRSSLDLFHYLKNELDHKLILSTHPERWPMTELGYLQSKFTDNIVNIFKKIV